MRVGARPIGGGGDAEGEPAKQAEATGATEVQENLTV